MVCTVYAHTSVNPKPRTSRGVRRSQFAAVQLSPGRLDFPTRYRGHRPIGSVRALINRSCWPGHRSDNNDDVNSPKNCETRLFTTVQAEAPAPQTSILTR